MEAILQGPRPLSHQWPRADVQRKRQPHAPVGTGSERQRISHVSSSRQQRSPQQPNVLHVSKSPDEVRKCAFSKVTRLQAAIASLDEDDQERSSLQQPLKTRPATDCASTCRSTHRRLRSVHRACEEAGPKCRSRREESGGGTALPRSLPLQSNVWSNSCKKLQGPWLFTPQFHQHIERKRRPPSQQFSRILLQIGLRRFRGCAPRWPDSRQVDLSGIRSKQPKMCNQRQKNVALN